MTDLAPAKKIRDVVELSEEWNSVTATYKIKKLLGEGSYGQVVLGKDRKTRKKVAIKYIKDYDQHEYDCVKILREIQILKELSNDPSN